MATEADATTTSAAPDLAALKAEVYDLLERQAQLDAARATLSQEIQSRRQKIARLSSGLISS